MNKWRIVHLGDLLKESKIESKSPDSTRRIRVKLNLGGIEKRPDINDVKGATKYYIRRSGQFIYGKQNLHKGAFGIVPHELDGFESSSDIPAFDISEDVKPEWILYFFKHNNFYLKLATLTKGVGSKRISTDKLFKLKIPVPTIEEQIEMINSFIAIDNLKDKLFREFEYQINLIEKLKSNVYFEFFTGKKSDLSKSETNDVVERSLVSKAEIMRKHLIPKDKKLLRNNYQGELYDIPSSWEWTILDNLLSVTSGVAKGKKYAEDLVSAPYLRVANVQREYLDLNLVKNLIVSRSDFEKYQLQKDDILMTEGGDADKVGRCALWNMEIANCIHQNHVFRLRPYDKSVIDEKFIVKYINWEFVRNYYQSSAKQTTNLASINKTVVRLTPIAIPRYKEQKVIVMELEKLDAFVNKILDEIQTQMKDIEAMVVSSYGDFFSNVNENLFNHIKPFASSKTKYTIEHFTKKINYSMKLEEILKEHGAMDARELWKMSTYKDNIDDFYEELKRLVEIEKIVRESDRKGYLELAL